MTVLLLSWLTLAAAPQEPAVSAGEPGPAARVNRALDEMGDVIFDDKSFDEAIGFFRNRLKIEIEVDPAVFQPEGFMLVNSRNASHREALRALLSQQGLHFAVVGGKIVIGSEDAVLHRQLRQVVSINADNTPLKDLLQRYADQNGANIVLDPRVQAGSVSLKLNDVPLESAVRLISELAGMSTVRLSNVLFVTSPESAQRLRPDADGPVPPAASQPNIMIGGVGGGGFPGVMPAMPIPVAPRR